MRADGPKITSVHHVFAYGKPHRFRLMGTDLGTARDVHLTDMPAGVTWSPERVTRFSAKTPTALEFTSTPTKTAPATSGPTPDAVGKLTITVTSPTPTPTPAASSSVVDSLYVTA